MTASRAAATPLRELALLLGGAAAGLLLLRRPPAFRGSRPQPRGARRETPGAPSGALDSSDRAA